MTEETPPPVESLAPKSPRETHFSWLKAARETAGEIGSFAGSIGMTAAGVAETINVLSIQAQINAIESLAPKVDGVLTPQVLQTISDLQTSLALHQKVGVAALAAGLIFFGSGVGASVARTIKYGKEIRRLEKEAT